MKEFLRLIYTSRATSSFDADNLDQLLEKSRSNNYGKGITGVLTFGHGFFLQVLEGPENELIKLYSTIMADPRHNQCAILDIRLTYVRMFSNWSMGYASFPGKIGGHYNELLDYRVINDNPEHTKVLLDSLLEIIRE
jgi:hypothetical protein